LEVSSLSDILASSGVFGFGISSKRVDKLIVDIPNLLELPKTMSSPDILSMVKAVEGFSTKTASNIVINLEKANTFMTELNRILPRETKVEAKEESKVEVRESRINNYKIVCTGFRDGDLEKEILLRGATIISTVSKNTDIVVVKNLNDKPTVKVSKAIQLGISIVQKDDFVKNYL
jgi:NAD-dependent DNA ligase